MVLVFKIVVKQKNDNLYVLKRCLGININKNNINKLIHYN